LRGPEPRAAPAPADGGEGATDGRRHHPGPVPGALHVRDRHLVAGHAATDIWILAWVEGDGLAEGVVRPVGRGRAALVARRRARVAALEGGSDVTALPRMRAVDRREGAVADREPHPVELREDGGERLRDLHVHDDLPDVSLLVEAVVPVAEDAQLR